MTTGLLGKAAIPADVYTPVYTVTAGKTLTANIRAINVSSTALTMRLAICPPGYVAGATPAATDWIEPLDLPLALGPTGFLEEVGMVIGAGEVIVAFASATGMTVRVAGFESAA